MDAVILDKAGGDLRDPLLAEKRKQVNANAHFVAVDILRASLTVGDDLVFGDEFLGGFLEGSTFRKAASPAVLAFEFEIPVFRKILCERETLLLGAGSMLSATYGGGALPIRAVRAAIDLNLAS